MQRVCARAVFVLVIIPAIAGILSNPVLAEVLPEFKNFGVYQDTDPNGVLDPGDTFLGGIMNWQTYDSAATSYNYGDHGDPELIGSADLAGAPWASDSPGDADLGWLPISNPDLSDDDVLHIYMVWSYYDNNSDEGEEYGRSGFSLGLLANSYIRERDDLSPSGDYHLNIAVRNDDSSVPQVTMSDDYLAQDPDPLKRGRPPYPGYKVDSSQEFYKTTVDLNPGALYNHYFEGFWEYTASTTDGGVIGGIHNGDYDVLIDPSDIVTSVSGDGLVIRIDPEALGEISKIIIYDFGYANGGYAESNPVELVIPLGTASDKTFFIASIPEVIPEPSALLSLLVLGGVIALARGRGKARM